tara:strand:- start:2291 stop:2938 length:648 start_codon:yes stop_codon:yes gene_type:complete
MANATNTFAVCAGYISGTYGFKQDILSKTSNLGAIVFWSMLGGGLGAYFLLTINEAIFLESIPWLLLFATILFLCGQHINQFFVDLSANASIDPLWSKVALAICLVLVSAYGGFFNAGLGVVILSYLVLAGYSDINQMNGVKLLVSSCVSIIAIVIFVMDGAIDWTRGLIVMSGTLVGGYVAARVSRNIEQRHVKNFVALSSIGMTCYFFWSTYA